MAYLAKNNKTILDTIPQPPPYFFNLTRKGGINVVGDAFYSPKRGSLLQPFQQSRRISTITAQHIDFLIGFLLVLFIPIISEIVQTILLRSRSNALNSSAFYTAYLVDEFSHMRNLWMHIAAPASNASRSIFARIFRSKSTKISLLALFIATFVFFADVAVLQLPQQGRTYSTASNFNLRAFQPIGTFRWRARNVRRRSQSAPCISPFVARAFETRHFQYSSCIFTESQVDLDRKKDVSSDISIASWYHKGGNDHIVSFANATIRISVRAQLIFSHTIWRILFYTNSNVLQDTQFIHNKTIYAAMQYGCNKKFSRLECLPMVRNLSVVSILQQNRTITLWQRNGTNITENVRGLVTTFNVRINQPFYALRNSTHYLMASSAIMDINGDGWYQHASTGREVHGISRLISEDGRSAGLPIIFFCVVIGVVVLAALRLLLNPTSLARMALNHMERRKRRMKQRSEISKESGMDTEQPIDEMGDSMGRKVAGFSAGDHASSRSSGPICSEEAHSLDRSTSALLKEMEKVAASRKNRNGGNSRVRSEDRRDANGTFVNDSRGAFSNADYEDVEYHTGYK